MHEDYNLEVPRPGKIDTPSKPPEITDALNQLDETLSQLATTSNQLCTRFGDVISPQEANKAEGIAPSSKYMTPLATQIQAMNDNVLSSIRTLTYLLSSCQL